MLVVTDKARDELEKVLGSEKARDKYLVLYFMGAGWSGPSVGMTLYESREGLDELESNGISAYIDPKLNEYLTKIGDINVDYISSPEGRNGYMIKIGEGNCGDCSCWSG